MAVEIGQDVLEALCEGDPCPYDDCGGTMQIAKTIGCRCHISPPCSACFSAGLECDECDCVTEDQQGREHERQVEQRKEHEARMARKPAVGSRREHTTTTHVANEFNSTPFTDCCGIAAINETRCPHCAALITHHDDGLDALRRKVGVGNCLMCGQRRGDPAVSGNCDC